MLKLMRLFFLSVFCVPLPVCLISLCRILERTHVYMTAFGNAIRGNKVTACCPTSGAMQYILASRRVWRLLGSVHLRAYSYMTSYNGLASAGLIDPG